MAKFSNKELSNILDEEGLNYLITQIDLSKIESKKIKEIIRELRSSEADLRYYLKKDE